MTDAHEILLGLAEGENENELMRSTAVVTLTLYWPRHTRTEQLARAIALDPRAPLAFRESVLVATRPLMFSWQGEAEDLLFRQAEETGWWLTLPHE